MVLADNPESDPSMPTFVAMTIRSRLPRALLQRPSSVRMASEAASSAVSAGPIMEKAETPYRIDPVAAPKSVSLPERQSALLVNFTVTATAGCVLW